MTTPWPTPGHSPNRVNFQYWKREYEPWSIEQERMRRDEALFQVGEYALFVLMWHQVDYEHGLIGRCQVCYQDPDDPLMNRAAQVYNQPTKNKCPSCYGTTFEGGVRAKIIRPLIVRDTDETETPNARGQVHSDQVDAETTFDFRSYQGDYVFRVDGSRWRILRQPGRTQVRTGFSFPEQTLAADGYTRMSLGYEEESTVAYMIPPATQDLKEALSKSNTRYPWATGSAPLEEINGPLIPEEEGVIE